MPFILGDAQCKQFRQDGYLIVERLFDADEVQMLGRIARADHELAAQAASRRDGEGGVIRFSVLPRWALICWYNAARNNPYKESRHPRYRFLEKCPHERIKAIGARFAENPV